MTLLGIDVGSSSVKAAVMRGGRVVGTIRRHEFRTRYDGTRAEIDPAAILRAVRAAISELGEPARRVDHVALSVMSPSWVAMDRGGKPLTPIVTHQDRRSVDVAVRLERRVGKDRHLELAGNRPFPGGISSSTCAWFLENEPALMRRADLVGHLSTLLHRRLTGARVTDPSNASFMGLYRTLDLGGWSDELCGAVGVSRDAMPDVLEADQVAGALTKDAARWLGVRAGTPVLAGLTDTGSAMLLAGARPGRLVNSAGSTDVLALCTDRPVPHERLLTRALGVGRLWLSVSTIAAAGSSVEWVKEQLFPDVAWPQFKRMIARAGRQDRRGAAQFEPYLAGDRTSVEQRTAAFTGLTLATTRDDLLAAVVDALARAGGERLELIRRVNRVTIDPRVLVTGRAADENRSVLRRDWTRRWKFRFRDEATLRGLALLHPR